MEKNGRLTEDAQHMNTILAQTLEFATKFLSSIEDRPVGIRPKLDSPTASPSPLPSRGIGAEAALVLFDQKYAVDLSASAGARYFGFVMGGSTPAAIAGDWLVSAFDQNVAGFGDSSAPFIEREALRWLAQMFGLSDAHSGTFVTGATMANFVGLAIARQWVAARAGMDVSQDGLYNLPRIKVLSGSPHSCIYKDLSMLGLGRKALRMVKCLPDREAIDISELRNELQRCASAGEACIVVANAGTVNSVDFDDLCAIADLKREFDFWLHVDAAFGGFAACSPKYSHLVKGLDAADSVAVDAHKWLNVPYDSAMQFTRHRQLQLEVFQNSGAYLRPVSLTGSDFLHLTPENSRRFRALPAWFSLVAYGSEGCGDIVEQTCEMARLLGQKIERSVQFRLLAPVRLNVVCFAPAGGDGGLEKIRAFVDALNETGETFVTPTVYQGVPGIRAAFSNWRTRSADVDVAWNSLLRTFEEKFRLPEES